MRLVSSLLVLSTLAAVSCKSEPTRSYCEAVCDYTVGCHEADRTVDADAKYADCLAATEATDDSCAKATNGEMSAANAKLLEPCVAAIDDMASAGECDPVTGRYDDIVSATAPKDCLSQGADAQKTFDAARTATQETGGELCQRFTDDFCGKVVSCIEEDVGTVPDAVSTALGGTPFELCVARMDPVFTTECTNTGLYEPPPSKLDEPTVAREGARECLRDFSALTCDAIFTGSGMDPTCAGAFANNDQLIAVAGVAGGLAGDIANEMGATGTTR